MAGQSCDNWNLSANILTLCENVYKYSPVKLWQETRSKKYTKNCIQKPYGMKLVIRFVCTVRSLFNKSLGNTVCAKLHQYVFMIDIVLSCCAV